MQNKKQISKDSKAIKKASPEKGKPSDNNLKRTSFGKDKANTQSLQQALNKVKEKQQPKSRDEV